MTRYGKDDRPALKLVNMGNTKGNGLIQSKGTFNSQVSFNSDSEKGIIKLTNLTKADKTNENTKLIHQNQTLKCQFDTNNQGKSKMLLIKSNTMPIGKKYQESDINQMSNDNCQLKIDKYYEAEANISNY